WVCGRSLRIPHLNRKHLRQCGVVREEGEQREDARLDREGEKVLTVPSRPRPPQQRSRRFLQSLPNPNPRASPPWRCAALVMANHGPSYGLSRELEKKNQARFSLDEAIEVLLWVENVTQLPYSCDPTTCQNAADVADLLKDGVHLCKLINRLLNNGSRAPFNPKPKMPFQKRSSNDNAKCNIFQMENISNFLEACKAYGVAEISCFQTVDLYENKQCYKVIECLRSLAAVAQARGADVEFPPWVVRLSHSRPRKFPESVMRRGEMVIPLQYGTNKCASQKGMTPYGLTRQIKPDPSG
ncbi:hypothetical protein Angca_004503, partial [Angiostrongylus cantonensis]